MSRLAIRRILALLLLAASYWIWTRHSDVIDLIVNERPVLFGRYSQGHFGSLLLLTPILWVFAGAFWSRAPLRAALVNALLGIFTTVVAILLVTYLAHFYHREANYVEKYVNDERAQALHLNGVTRHRPPNEHYDLVYRDVPEQARSYPDAPPGYGEVRIVLTSDKNGFRNQSVADRYDIIAVGDSFVAGSQISDDQCWTELLARQVGRPVYNLGVAGSGPITYLNNFAYFGVPLRPRIALFMLYEGNDFKEDVAVDIPAEPSLRQQLSEHFDFAIHSSPVTLGLRRLSNEWFEKLGAQRPIPDYQQRMGWMPVKVAAGGQVHYYAFPPKRMLYLNESAEKFGASREWQFTRDVLDKIVRLSRDNGITPVFVYAPSAPHVVLPLVRDAIPAEQLRRFAAYKGHNLPPAESFKQQLFENLDGNETTFSQYCRQAGVDCVSLTNALRDATSAGQQTYYTYEQHWTPVGNAVAEAAIHAYLQQSGLLDR